MTLSPSRGALKDRNGNLMVYNQAMYDLKTLPTREEIIQHAEPGVVEPVN